MNAQAVVYFGQYFSNFDSLKSTETALREAPMWILAHFSNFDSLKSTETG